MLLKKRTCINFAIYRYFEIFANNVCNFSLKATNQSHSQKDQNSLADLSMAKFTHIYLPMQIITLINDIINLIV